MTLGEKIFEETGQVTGFKIIQVHPVEGTAMEVSSTSDIRGIGKFPSGKNISSGVMKQYPHGVVDASYQGNLNTPDGDKVIWWAHEKSKTVGGNKIKGLVIISTFTNSQKLSWINNLIILAESEVHLSSLEFEIVAYEWKQDTL